MVRTSKMDRDEQINAFAGLAKEYCKWTEGIPGTQEEEQRLAARFLAKLYLGGLELALVEPFGDFDTPQRTQNDYQRIHKRFGALPFQYYYEVFNPFTLYADNPEEPTIGDVCDDLTDIYTDLKKGLVLWEKGEHENAVFVWENGFGIHWGRHATSALRAFHCYESSEEHKP